MALGGTADCRELVDGIEARVRANYAGFRLEVHGARRDEYDRMVERLRGTADRSPDSECLAVLREYVGWFADPHLFVFQSWRIDSAETSRRMPVVPTVSLDLEAVHARLVDPAIDRDPIEGVWYDRDMRMAVIPDPDGTTNR